MKKGKGFIEETLEFLEQYTVIFYKVSIGYDSDAHVWSIALLVYDADGTSYDFESEAKSFSEAAGLVAQEVQKEAKEGGFNS